jgi:hypothetical protein
MGRFEVHSFARALRALWAASLALSLASCESEHAPLVKPGERPPDTIPDDTSCSAPNLGCPCTEEGHEVECGKATQVNDDYVTCSLGTRTCADGKWGACVGDRVTTKAVPRTLGGQQLMALGTSTACPVGFDLCDPNCSLTSDTAGGFNAGANFSNTPSGLTLVGTLTPVCTSLSLTPSTPDVYLTGPSLASLSAPPVTFTLTASPANCIVAPFNTTWTIDKFDRATISGTTNTNGTLTVVVPMAGNILVTAFAAGKSASTTIKTHVNVLEAPLLDALAYGNKAASAAQILAFGTVSSPNAGSGGSSATWLYPYANTYFPLALPSPTAQYRYTNGAGDSTAAASATKVSLRYPSNTSATAADFNYSLVVKEGNAIVCNATAAQCNFLDPQVMIPQLAWRYFEQTARGFDGDILVQRLRARTVAPDVLEPEQRLTVRFVDGQLKGTVFYNSYTSPQGGNTGAILAITPGATSPTLAVQPSGTCSTCHSINIDGTRLVTNGGKNASNAYSYDQSELYNMSTAGPSPTVLNTYTNNRYTYGGPWVDGSLYMSHGGGADPAWHAPTAASGLYKITDSTTAVTLTNWPSNVQAVTPRFSPDGTKLAFGFWSGNAIPCSSSAISPCSGTPRTLTSVSGGTRLAVMDFTCGSSPCTGSSTGWTVSNARDVTPGVTERVAWPSFSPDGSSVAYQRQYRSSKALLSWTPQDIGTVAGALAEIWLSNVPANGNTASTPTRLSALNGVSSAGTSYLPEQARTLVNDANPLYVFDMARHEMSQVFVAGVQTTPQNVTDPAVSFSGVPSGGPWDARVKIIAGGARGTATFQVSTDGGTTWSATTATSGTPIAVGTTGMTVNFVTGTYVANTTYKSIANAVQVTGTPAASPWDLRVKIVVGGALGVATYQYSTDGGATWSVAAVTATRVAIGATGLAANFPSATYVAGNIYSYAGTFSPNIFLTGSPAGGPWDTRFKMIAGGGVGTATFQYSTDGGSTWSGTTTTAATVSIGSTGMKATFAAGTYYANSLHQIPVGRVGLQGTPTGGPWDFRVQIVTAGALGTATFKYSSDGGTTWSAALTTAATVSLGTTGMVATFASITYPSPAWVFGAFVAHYHQNNATYQMQQADSCSNNVTSTGNYDYRLNYLPSFAPTAAGGKSWIVFTSRRMYGNVAYENGFDAEPGYSCYSGKIPSKKLWIAAIDSTAAGSWTPGNDPSHPAFYLPGQELAAGNSDGHWVNAPCTTLGNSCETDDDCCGGTGASPTAQCRVTSTATFPPTRACQARSSCAPTGVSCLTTADCCTGLTCPSGGGLCLVVPPKLFEDQTTTREYTATCPSGKAVKWRFFEWQSTIPTATSIDFYIQTKQKVTDSYLPATKLAMATANQTSAANQWLRGAKTNDQLLVAAGLVSMPYLQVTMTFHPNAPGTLAPTLLAWRQIYDCVDSE